MIRTLSSSSSSSATSLARRSSLGASGTVLLHNCRRRFGHLHHQTSCSQSLRPGSSSSRPRVPTWEGTTPSRGRGSGGRRGIDSFTRSISRTRTKSNESLSTTKTSSTTANSTITTSSRSSNMARGTSFEHLSLTLLNQNFGMELERVGGAGDKGIDLKGWWDLTSLLLAQAEPQASQRVSSGGGGGGAAAGGPKRLRVIAQCKCLDPSRKLGPSVVREIEGVLHRALTVPSGGLSNRSSSPSPSSPQSSPSSDDQHPVAGSERGQNVVGGEPGGGGMGLVGALLSSSGFSKQATLQARSSSFPLLLIHIQSLPEAYIMDHLEMVDKASNYQATSPPPPREKRTTPTSPSKSTKSNRLEEMVKDGDRFLSVIWNDALASTRGPLQGRMEFRFQRDLRSYRKGSVGGTAKDQVTDYKEEDGRVGRPVLYWDGKKLKL